MNPEARNADALPRSRFADVLRWSLAVGVVGLAFAAGLGWLWRQSPQNAGQLNNFTPLTVELVAKAVVAEPGPAPQVVQAPEPEPPAPVPEPSEPAPAPPEPALPAEVEEPPPGPAEPSPPTMSVPMPVLPSPELMASRAATPATLRQPVAPQRSTANPAQSAPSAEPATQSRATGVSAADERAWQGRVVNHLYRFRDYPADARRSRIEGVVTLRFSIDATGRVLSSEIAGSSGHASLDGAVRSLIGRASPVPTPPEGLSAAKRTLVVPIEFRLR